MTARAVLAAGGAGSIMIRDIAVAGGTVTNKVWQDPVGQTVLQSCTVSGLTIDVTVRSTFPVIDLDGNSFTLPQSGDVYEDTVQITISGAKGVVATAKTGDDGDGSTDTCAVAYTAPPAVTSALFTGGYPGSQTEMKEDDNFDIAITADKNFDRVRVLNHEACKLEEFPVAATSSTTVAATIDDEGDTAVARPARVQVRDATTGAWSATYDTDTTGSADGVNTVSCNNLAPSGAISSIVYPGVQDALKASETATVNNTASNYDTIAYSDPTASELSITNQSTFEAAKTVQRIGGGYNVSSTNFRVTLNRAANDATTVVNDVVQIANTPLVVTVSPATARVRSGVAPGNDTTITISADQQILGAPTLDPAVGRGTFQGSWAGSGTSRTRALRVPDSENPATGGSHTWLNPSVTNLAGIATTSITTGPTYVIGGFTTRTVNYPAFTANSTESFPLTTEAKLAAGVFSNGNTAVVQPFGTADTTDVGKEGWCAPTAASGTAVNMRMLHSPSVAANSGGLTLTLVEETV